MKKLIPIVSLFLFASLYSVASEIGDRTIPADVAQLSDSLKRQYAPDKRVALFDVDYSFSGKNVMLRGVTTSAEAKAALLNGLSKADYQVMDCLQVLPDEAALEEMCIRDRDMEAQLPLAYGTALVLIIIILFVNLLANALRKYFEKKVKMN